MTLPELAKRVPQLDEDIAAIAEVQRVHTAILKGHTGILKSQEAKLDQHTATLAEHTAKLDQHTATLAEHGRILGRIEDVLVTVLERLPAKQG